jgi:hypothetical protein
LSRSIRRYWKLGAVAASCLAIGAGASVIANAGASTTNSTSTSSAKSSHLRRGGGLRARRLIRRAVHGELVVATRTGYATITFDRGTVQSVSGRQLTLRDGRKASTYKVLALTIPTNARVREDRKPATLADLKPGQRAEVIQAPKRTLVIARSAP